MHWPSASCGLVSGSGLAKLVVLTRIVGDMQVSVGANGVSPPWLAEMVIKFGLPPAVRMSLV